jgi:Right handed beta helix region
MFIRRRAAAAAALLLLVCLRVDPADAAVQRTFVATTGNDGNPCSIAQPCRSFGAAIAQTTAGGEVIVLDSGAYGRVTVSKSVTIEAPAGVYAGISVFAAPPSIDVNAPGATVTLRGLSINGQGGNIGIYVAAVADLRIDRCRVSGMGQQGIYITAGRVAITHGYLADNGHDGVNVGGIVDVLVEDTTSVRNLSGAAFYGGARAVVRDSVLSFNQDFGVYSSAGPTATPTIVNMDNVTSSHNGWQGFYMGGVAGGFGSIAITRSTVVANGRNGFWGDGAGGPINATISDSTFMNHPVGFATITVNDAARLVVSRNVVIDNGSFGLVQFSTSIVDSRGDNTIRNNNGGGVQTAGTIGTFGGI